ncbi:MAG: NAD(P)-binding domain-containing protein, partial [Alloalcanivorax xenomutans]
MTTAGTEHGKERMAQQLIGFIGAGNMATSLAGGMIAKGIRPARIWMSDPS